ncbi:MAG: hypothetical protein ACPG5B_15595 [Chitinophagales bacterium]
MIDNNKDKQETYVSGNIFGWRISFMSLGVVLFTLIAAILIGDPEDHNKNQQNKNNTIDTTMIQKTDTVPKVRNK